MDLVISGNGAAVAGDKTYKCAIGRSGIRREKREGDGATPAGTYRLVEIFYRPDRVAHPQSVLNATALTECDGWCDDSHHPDYNTRIVLPHPARCENLWRADSLYDLVVTTDHNTAPIVPGAGSAIFVHVASSDWMPTEGCVAFDLKSLEAILSAWTPESRLIIQ